jgi:hypothetical protein
MLKKKKRKYARIKKETKRQTTHLHKDYKKKHAI